MIDPRKNEPRIKYLARVLHALMYETVAGECTIEYDGTECDDRSNGENSHAQSPYGFQLNASGSSNKPISRSGMIGN